MVNGGVMSGAIQRPAGKGIHAKEISAVECMHTGMKAISGKLQLDLGSSLFEITSSLFISS
ncbi:hypothetical protein AVEN_112849-1, partial [Araneus ventricosus]